MPRKIREFKTQVAREGFIYLPKRGKGRHERWRHPMLGQTLTISVDTLSAEATEIPDSTSPLT